ncbi:MAG: glycosyltransferase family 2 protein [Pseudonocardia sp.]|nr:glycosyltransferase family 2 protein [Pseudonocardia sp.]
MTPTVGVVVLAWQDEPYLAECIAAVRASVGVDTRLVVVDNGSPDIPPDVDVLKPGRNTGFAGGCNLGAAALDTEYLALVNSDCVVAPDALAQLVAEAARPGVGPVMASIRLPDGRLNSGGNPVHLIGLSWAGGLHSTETRTAPYDVTGASGACLLLAATVWKQLGGFDEEYFAYLEDSELSLRAWRLGLAARCVPTAVARHHYEFSRNAFKMHLLERNRLMLLATVWPRRALLLLAPVLAPCELLLLAYGTASGWRKLAGYGWLWRHRGHLRARRRLIQEESTDRTWMARLSPTLDRAAFGPLTPLANAVFRAHWSVVRRLL